jgi:hypothetical protein
MAGMNEDLGVPGGLSFGEIQVSTIVDPFDGDSQRFDWPHPVSIGQLQVEVEEALGEHIRVAFIPPVDEEGADEEVSEEHPLIVYVTPSSADVTAVRQVMAAHRPDPYYGMTDEERQAVQLQEKIRSGAELSMEEIQTALRMLVS